MPSKVIRADNNRTLSRCPDLQGLYPMSASMEATVSRLSMAHRKLEIERCFDGPWITLYERQKGERSSVALYSALVAKTRLPASLSERGWDLMLTSTGGPTYIWSNEKVRYERYGTKGIEPLVVVRHFRGLKPRTIEISEEFRFFHDLYHDRDAGQYIQLDESGDDYVIAEVTPDRVRVRKPALTEFLAAKQMYLAQLFEFDETEPGTDNPVPLQDREEDIKSTDRIWGRYMTTVTGEVLSRMTGKIVLAPPRRPRASEMGKRDKDYEEFIIGYDDAGLPRMFNSNPDELANYFGKNPSAPHYLTPVHFRKDVLNKYYARPERYSVEDGLIRAKGAWLLRLDNDHSDRVIVFLGDLGRDLPRQEQAYWKSYNITPDVDLSKTAIRRAFLAEFADASQIDHTFRQRYQSFHTFWRDRHGWDLFRPLNADDQHALVRLHIPTSSSPSEIDHQILGLAKIMVDSLNDAELERELNSPIPGERSIAKFGRFLKLIKYPNADRDLELVRTMQGLRSTGAAHRRGSNYTKLIEKMDVAPDSPQTVEKILGGLIAMLEDLQYHVEKTATK